MIVHLQILSSRQSETWIWIAPISKIVTKMFANYTAYKGHLFLVLILSSLVTNSSDVFTNLFHNFFPRNFSVWQLKNKLFFLSFPDKKEIKLNICLLKKFVDSEFQIGEAIWWIRCCNVKVGSSRISLSNSKICKVSKVVDRMPSFKGQEVAL